MRKLYSFVLVTRYKLMAFRITSRKYYNFTNDAHRKGATIKPFTEKQSWNLLMNLLGPEWVEQDRKGLIRGSEEKAAIEMLKHLGGVSVSDCLHHLINC